APPSLQVGARASSTLRVTLKSGKTIVLYEAWRTADSIVGSINRDETRRPGSVRPQVAFATADVRLVQNHRLDGVATAAAIVLPVGILAIMGVAAMASFDGPFGSCC